jgi:hypothetical protein
MLHQRGMELTEGEFLRFLLPCPQLKGTSCGIYGSRPAVCGRYRCRILRDVEAGAIELPDAVEKVREGRRLYEDTLRVLPPGMTLPQARALWTGPQDAAEGPGATRYPAVVLQVLVLMRHIDQHFRHSDEGPLLSENVLTMDGSESSPRKDS